MARVIYGPVRQFWGEVRPPSDKSLTHRAYMLSAIAKRGGVVLSPLRGQDCEDTLRILQELGARVENRLTGIEFFPSELSSLVAPLYCGNSGTTMRLMAGLIAGLGLNAELRGDESLTKRPMRRVVEPLRLMGAEIDGETPPLYLRGGGLHGIDYSLPVASAQVKSAILLAGLFADSKTTVREPVATRDHTERMLAGAGCKIEVKKSSIVLFPGLPQRIEMRVPGDISSAAFLLVASALIGGPLTLKEVGINPSRTGVLDILKKAGVPLQIESMREETGEPVADLFIPKRPDILKAFQISGDLVPRLIDEIPILAVLATQCSGTSVIRDAGELRVKESDRIEKVVVGLKAMGANVVAREDGMEITGPTPLLSGTIDAKGDHRIAMAFAVAGLIATGGTTIHNSDSVETSFPGFFDELRRLSFD